MKYPMKFIVSVLCLFPGLEAFTQSFEMSLHSEQLVANSGFQFTPEKWIEDESARTLFSSTWQIGEGKIIIEQCSRPINYHDAGGMLRRINANANRADEGWLAGDQPHPVFLGDDGTVTVSYGQHEQITFQGRKIFGQAQREQPVVAKSQQHFTMNNTVPGIDKEFIIEENALKYQYVLNELPEVNQESFEVVEKITVPDGARVVVDAAHGQYIDDWWFGNLVLTSNQGEVLSVIFGTVCFDATNNFSKCGYQWKKLDQNTFELTTQISHEWLFAPDRHLPIVIDPLVTGPLSEFGDNMMPSCFIPQYNTDSLLITVPGQITVTGFFVTASFYADPFAPAIMADGSMYFSTTCDSSQTFEVAPPNGELPGTAFLEFFDFRNPLMCCFTPSCNETSFYFRMHLGRYTPEGDCNLTYVYYNPVTKWPFTAYIEGHTVETYGAEWTVTNTPICSSQCQFEGVARIKYGVPPYTLTHPWMEGSMVVEEATPCDLSNKTAELIMSWPGCPQFCPDPFTLDVPPPTIIDVCGNVVADVDPETLNIKPAPDIIDPSPVTACSNTLEYLGFASCAPDYSINWAGNGTSGTGEVPLLLENQGSSIVTYNFQVHTNWNNCPSDTLSLDVQVYPSPLADFHVAPDPAMQNIPAYLVDDSTTPVGQITGLNWSVDGGPTLNGNLSTFIVNTLGFHSACLEAVSTAGCRDTICKDFEVITARIIAPNVFTPNGDGLNETLEFLYLDFFPENHLQILNRWGNIVHEEDNYKNNWDADGLTDGTYYYILEVKYLGSFSGYFQILH